MILRSAIQQDNIFMSLCWLIRPQTFSKNFCCLNIFKVLIVVVPSVTRCGMENVWQRSGGIYWLHIQCRTLRCFSANLVCTYQYTCCHNPEGHSMNFHFGRKPDFYIRVLTSSKKDWCPGLRMKLGTSPVSSSNVSSVWSRWHDWGSN